jgi:transketolase
MRAMESRDLPLNQLDAVDIAAHATHIRRLALEMVTRARASHIGSALSAIDVLATLYGAVMRYDALNPNAPWRDRFILSKGHACVSVYATLAEFGIIPESLLQEYGQDFSILMHHISHKVPGVEFSTGSLGHGLPFGVGKAMAAKRKGLDWRTYVLLGDGEMAEGSNWEAMLIGRHHKLDNLVAIVDCNNLQSLTTVEATLAIEPLADKIRAFGWHAVEVDGHDYGKIQHALTLSPERMQAPTMIIARTIKGKGVSYMENQVAWHYKSPSPDQLAEALAGLPSSSHHG